MVFTGHKNPMRTVLIVLGCFIATLLPGTVEAQSSDRLLVSVNAGTRSAGEAVTSTMSFDVNLESGSFTSQFQPPQKASLDTAAYLRAWRQLVLGIGFTSYTGTAESEITGRVPHPFFFNQPRSVAGAKELTRKETAVHLRAGFASPSQRRFQLLGYVGAALFSVKQDVIDSISFADAYPFDSADFTAASVRTVSKSKVGISLGADLAFFVSKNLGLGVQAGFSRASPPIAAKDSSSIAITAGGSFLGGGLRLRF